jgi:hypothetical protein
MSDLIHLAISRNDVGQILDGLEQRRIIWQATAEYLETGHTDLSDHIEECHNPHEARTIAETYEYLIDKIRSQRDGIVNEMY